MTLSQRRQRRFKSGRPALSEQSESNGASYFADRYTREPLTLFRIFNYPGDPAASDDHPSLVSSVSQLRVASEPRWGVGEHTDYGLLTILKQDDTGGLEVKSGGGWISAPPIPVTFLCNIGDMLNRMTAGQYGSTSHRVQNLTRRDRLSFPFFFDPKLRRQDQSGRQPRRNARDRQSR